MTKKELVLEVIDRLKKEYPDADCYLDVNELLARKDLDAVFVVF